MKNKSTSHSNEYYFAGGNNSGAAMLVVLVLAVVLGIVITSISFSSRHTNKKSGERKATVDLFNIAEGGMQAALAKLRIDDIDLAEGQSAIFIPSTALGNGFFEVTYKDFIPGSSLKLSAKGMIGQREKTIDALVEMTCKNVDFTITDGKAIPLGGFKPTVTILGAAVTYGTGGYKIPVTIEVNVGTNKYCPFGSINLPVDGNVNSIGNPRIYSLSDIYAAGTAVSIRAKSWVKKSSSYSGTQNSHWQLYREVSSTPDNGWVKVLRDNDTVPDLDGFGSQADVETFIRAYVDTSKLIMNLGPNDVIYLVEFGSQTGTSADYQDCVVLVTLNGKPTQGGVCGSWSYKISNWSER